MHTSAGTLESGRRKSQLVTLGKTVRPRRKTVTKEELIDEERFILTSPISQHSTGGTNSEPWPRKGIPFQPIPTLPTPAYILLLGGMHFSGRRIGKTPPTHVCVSVRANTQPTHRCPRGPHKLTANTGVSHERPPQGVGDSWGGGKLFFHQSANTDPMISQYLRYGSSRKTPGGRSAVQRRITRMVEQKLTDARFAGGTDRRASAVDGRDGLWHPNVGCGVVVGDF
ncbi:tRNA pseudouridine synthase D [Anopheles sinensis]|uniref:tRNA pseudouridine synthase D n=1 Tax=Anopheles sinensis TaxID=74873 RepID=A0A084WFB7_ANOSI|nr:tRNA pseudouridine synthase D [Anopheles sinensis]